MVTAADDAIPAGRWLHAAELVPYDRLDFDESSDLWGLGLTGIRIVDEVRHVAGQVVLEFEPRKVGHLRRFIAVPVDAECYVRDPE